MRPQQTTPTPTKPSSSRLSTMWRARYPGSYDDLNDDELEQLIVKRYPGSYDDLITPKTTTDTVGTIISQPTLDVPELPEPPKGVSHGPIIDNLWKFGARLGDTASSMFSSTDAQQLAKASHQLKQARLLEEKGTAEAKAARDMQVKQEYSDWGKGLESRIKSPWGIAEAATSAVDPTGFLPSYVGLGEQSVEDIKQKNWGGLGANVTLGAAPFVLPYLRGKVSRAGIPPEYIPEKPNVRVVPPVEPIGQRQLGGQVQANYNAPVDAEFTVGKSRPPRALLGPPSRGLLGQGQPPIVPPVEPVSPIPNQTGIVPRPTTYNPFKADALPPIEELPKDIKQVQGSIVSSRALPPVEPIRQLPTIVPPGNMPPPAALPQRLPLPPVNTDVVGQNLGPVNPADFGPKAQEYLQRWHSGRDIYGHERLPKTFKTAAEKRDEEDFLRSMDWQKEHDQPGLSPRDVSDIVGDVTKSKQEVIGPGGQPLTPRTEKNVTAGRPKEIEPKKIKLYRWQSEPGQGIPNWVKESPEYKSSKAVEGGWFTDNPEHLEFYMKDSGGRGHVVTIEVTPEEAEKYSVVHNKEAMKYSGDPASEYLIPPRDVETSVVKEPVRELPTVEQPFEEKGRLAQFRTAKDESFKKANGLYPDEWNRYQELSAKFQNHNFYDLPKEEQQALRAEHNELHQQFEHVKNMPKIGDIQAVIDKAAKPKFELGDLVRHKEHGVGRIAPEEGQLQRMNVQELDVYRDKIVKNPHPTDVGGDRTALSNIDSEFLRRRILGIDPDSTKPGLGLVPKKYKGVKKVTKPVKEELPPVEPIKEDNSLASRWQAQVDELDRTNAPDTDYRDIMSTGSKAGLKKGETWRGRVLKYIDMDKNPRVEPVKEPITGTTNPRFVGAQGTGEGIVYLQFDNRGRIPSVKDVQDMFPDHPNIAVTRFKREGSLRPDLTKFRIDTHGVGKGTWGTDSYSSKVEKEIMESVGGRFMEWNTPDPTKIVPEVKELPAVEPVRNTIDEAFARVVDRMDTKGETLNQAIEAVYPDYGGKEFAKQLEAHARMEPIDIKDIEPSKASWFKNPDLKDEHRDFLKKVLGIDDAQIDSLTRDKVTSLIASYNKYKEFEKAYDELVPVKDRRYVIHDAGGRYTQQELDNFNNSPRIIRIADIMENVLGELNTLFPEQLGATEKFGFLLGNKGDGGVNVADPEFIITKKRKTGVLANLFDAIQQEDNPKAASQRFLHYIKHEFTHNLIREEGGQFTWAFAKVDSRLPLESQLNAKRLIHSSLTEANGNYAPEIQKLILQHTKARGRADTKVDVLSGPAKSPISEFTGQSRISGGDKPDGTGVSKGVTVDADKILEDALRESGVSEEAIQAAIAESKAIRAERVEKIRAKIAAKKLAGQKVNKLEPEVEAGSGGGGAKEPPKPPTTNAPSTPPPPIPPTGKASGKQKGKKVKVPKTVEEIIAAKKAKNAAVPVPTITAAVKALPDRFRNTSLYRHIYEPSGVSGLTRLERMGEGGKKLAKLLRDERTESSRAGGEHALITRKVKRSLSKDEWHEVASILDGQKPLEDASSQKIKDAYTDLRESTDILGDEAIAAGMKMKTSKGDVVPFEKFKGEYWPHRYPKELFKDTKSLREKLLKAGNSPVVVDAIIKNVVEKGERFSSAQHAREFNLPGYSMEPEALEAHQYEMARATTRAKRFGPGDVADKDSVISKLIRETNDPARAEQIVNDYLGRVEHNPDMEGQQGLYDKIVTAEVGMHLSQFGLTNMGDLAPMSAAMGAGNVFNAINEVIANPHGSVDIGVRTGAHNIIRNELLHDVGAGNLLGKAYGTQTSEKILRTVGALAGRANVKRLFALAKRKPKYAKMLSDFVDGDVNTVLKQDRLTPRQIDFGAARGVELSSGIPDKLTLGKAFFNKNPLLRLPYLFKRFAFVNVRNMVNAVKRQPTWAGKLAKAGAILALYQIAGEGIGDAKAAIKGLASGEIEKDLSGRGDYIESKNWPLIGKSVGGEVLDRIMANYLQSALFGIVGDVTESISKRSIGKVTGVVGGPFGSDIDELAYGLGSILYPPKEGNRFAPLGKAIAKKIPYIGAGLAERWEKQKQPTLKGLSP